MRRRDKKELLSRTVIKTAFQEHRALYFLPNTLAQIKAPVDSFNPIKEVG